jgi:hypothetical protein
LQQAAHLRTNQINGKATTMKTLMTAKSLSGGVAQSFGLFGVVYLKTNPLPKPTTPNRTTIATVCHIRSRTLSLPGTRKAIAIAR